MHILLWRRIMSQPHFQRCEDILEIQASANILGCLVGLWKMSKGCRINLLTLVENNSKFIFRHLAILLPNDLIFSLLAYSKLIFRVIGWNVTDLVPKGSKWRNMFKGSTIITILRSANSRVFFIALNTVTWMLNAKRPRAGFTLTKSNGRYGDVGFLSPCYGHQRLECVCLL